MIELYTGTPGSGKSLHLAWKIRKWVGRDYPVIGNFEVRVRQGKKNGGYLYLPNDEMTVERLMDISEQYKAYRKWDKMREESMLLIIDECQLQFNARDWQREGRSKWLWFFTQHRKLGYNVVLCCQYDQMIDKQLRSLVEYEYIHRKVSNIGIGGKIISMLAGGKLHVIVKVYYPLNEKVGTEWVKAKSSLYSIYDTYNMFDGAKRKGVGVGTP